MDSSKPEFQRRLGRARETPNEGQSLADWISQIGTWDNDIRGKASDIVIRAGKAASPYLHELIKSADFWSRNVT